MDIDEFEKDWRNMGQMEYLFKKKFKYIKYSNNIGDHEHCVFCSEKISTMKEAQNEAYCTKNYKHFVCIQCFNDFKEIFEWEIV